MQVSCNSRLSVIIIVAVSLAVYLGSLSGEFIYDDILMIPDNPWLKDVRNVPKILFSGAWAYSDYDQTSNYYRPLAFLIYMIDYRLFGLDPWGYHLTSVLLHSFVSVLVFLVAAILMRESRLWQENQSIVEPSNGILPPLIAGLLFATHPIHSEPVMWISSVSDIGFSLFYLLAFYFYVSGRTGLHRVLSPLFFFIACLGKETALTLPIMLFAYDAIVRREVIPSPQGFLELLKRYAPFILVAIAYFALRMNAIGEFAPVQRHQELGTYGYLINIFPLFAQYLGALALPVNLNVYHVLHPISSLLSVKGLVSVVATLGYVIACIRLAHTHRMLAFFLVWISIPLLVVLYIPALGENTFAERYLYLPSVGFVLLLSIGLGSVAEQLSGSGKRVRLAHLLLPSVAIIAAYSAATVSRSPAWQNNIALWADSVAKDDKAYRVRINLGDAYLLAGRLDEAIDELRIAAEFMPDAFAPHYSLATAYSRAGRFDEAIAEYRAVLTMKPDHVRAQNDLGLAYATVGNVDAAIMAFQAALRLKQDFFDARHNLGAMYGRKGMNARAIEELEAAVRLKPEHAGARFHLGIAYSEAGRSNDAIRAFQEVLSMQPSHEGARNMLQTLRRN